MAKKTDKTEKKQNIEAPRASIWSSRFKEAESNQNELFTKFERFYDIMYAVHSTKNMAPWRSKVYIPILASKAWDIISKFVGVMPGFEVNIRDETPITPEEMEDIRDRQERAEEKLKFDWNNPLLDDPISTKLFDGLMDGIVTGTGVWKVPWRVMTEKQYARPIEEDGISVDTSKEIVREIVQGCNDIEPVNIFNFFIEPSATSLQKANWVIIRDYVPLYTLKSRNKEDGVEIYKNLDKIDTFRSPESGTFADRNKARNRLLGIEDSVGSDETTEYVEVYECYDKEHNTIQTFVPSQGEHGKRWLEIRRQKNVYWHGKFPIVAFNIRRKPFGFWGESLFEGNERLQAATNDLFNHYLDNWNLSIDSMIMQDDSSIVDDFIVEPGGTIVYSGEKPDQFRFPEPNPLQLTTVLTEIDKAIEASTIPQFSSGVPDSSLDKTQGTATGIIRLQEAANDKLGFMRSNFQKAILQMGNMWLMNSQQFMDRPITVYTRRNSRQTPMTITPADLQGVLELKIDASTMEPVSKVQAKQEFIEFTAQQLQLQTASLQQSQITKNPNDFVALNFHQIMSEAAHKYGIKNFDQFVRPADTNPQGVTLGPQTATGETPTAV